MDELFDVFDEDATVSAQHTKRNRDRKQDGTPVSPPKAQEAGSEESGSDEDNGDSSSQPDSDSHSSTQEKVEHEPNTTVSLASKRQRSHSGSQDEDEAEKQRVKLDDNEAPVVTDDFETKQSREVAGAAGLQAQQESAAVVLSHQVRHQVALPPRFDYVPISQHKPPEKPARTWPFTLDPFQQVSIASIQRNESVLVSAHTSAGKTVVAEYAIAQCLANNQRVIYTSPIKALSNQKFREFTEEFVDVGLMTGDVTINPTATCLVMTTEILRSMLYRGSEIMREVAWVVFDEVHYLRDKSRGVVWEETIILLPDKVRYVFLSATIPNSMQFAEWITKIHSQPCHVVYTDFRPTPLQHYLFPAGAGGIHLVVDEKGVFREKNFREAMSSIGPSDEKKKGGKPDKGGAMKSKDGPSDIYKIIKVIMMKNYNPVIVFSFSKRECENLALQMSSLAFNDDSEKRMVNKVFNNAIEMLSEKDRELNQIQSLLPLLRRGIGVHHSGLLPILKETIEILFQEGLIKVLFATETFSIGLNMPAKTVVFTSVRKFDGVATRWVTPSEFIQMSGRAGRRGLDTRGIVILMVDEEMEPGAAREIVRGEQDKLNSAFHLGYNMILNLMRVESISPEFMLERSFFQFQNTSNYGALEKKLAKLEEERDGLEIADEGTIREYYDLRQRIDAETESVREVITHPTHCLPFLQPGRLIQVKHNGVDFGWGAVVQVSKRKVPRGQNSEPFSPHESYIVDTILVVASDSTVEPKAGGAEDKGASGPGSIRPPPEGDKGKAEVVPMMLHCISAIAHIRIHVQEELRTAESRNVVRKTINEVKRRFPDGIATLDPVKNMKIEQESFKKALRKIEALESRLLSNPLYGSDRLPALYDQYAHKVGLGGQMKETKKAMAEAMSVIQLEELKCRKWVLRRLGFTNESDVVELKARVACEISTGDELVLSELLFNRFFNELGPEQIAACLSCFIFEEKSKDEPKLRDELAKPFREIQAQARVVAKVSQECKLAVDEDEYLATFKYQLMEVVYAWAKGASFVDICSMTDIFEGSLIRLFRRLEELLRQMAQASKVMGSDELEQKFTKTLELIKRDIVAAQSLYLN